MTITEFLLARCGDDEAIAASQPCRDTSASSRSIAEVKAKRRIIEAHPLEPGYTARGLLGCRTCNTFEFERAGRQTLPGVCDTLLALASIYADHEGWSEEWDLRASAD